MTVVFFPRADKDKKTPVKGDTLGQFLTAHGLGGQLDQVARLNWATTDVGEINRALVEIVGCSSVQPNPLNSVLDPDLGTKKSIYLPVPWKPAAALALEKTHTVKVKLRRPVPAVAITAMTSWFIPNTGSCAIDYTLEGVSARADKVDFEVHATHYFEIGKSDSVKPSDTDADPGSTHIFRHASVFTIADPVADRRPPATARINWDGESRATKGVLAKPPSAKAYVTHACAPYTVNLRYYKDPADAKAKLTLKPFVPRWQAVPNQANHIDASLVVEWEIKDDNGKLKAGQLLIYDKAGAIVFRAPLDEVKVKGGRYDLVNDPLKPWPKAGITKADMPYRAQIQAHSDEDEENGLAIAAMPTVVRAFDYANVQFIALKIQPGTENVGTAARPKKRYLGDPTDENDIIRRCDIMKDAIRTANLTANQNLDTLKIFMAPEFYFRGRDGAYPLEKLSTILKIMREETDKFEYADWLFVMGTAIGYLDHEKLKRNQSGTGDSIRHEGLGKHNILIESVTIGANDIQIESTFATPEVGWKLQQGRHSRTITAVAAQAPNKWVVTLNRISSLIIGAADILEPIALVIDQRTVGTVHEIKVRSKVCSRIPAVVKGTRNTVHWVADQGWFTKSVITACAHDTGDDYWLTLNNSKNYDIDKSISLIEPVSTEVINISQVQRGWPAPALHPGLTAVVVDKESVSAIDYIGKNSRNLGEWFAADGIGHVIDIHGKKNRTVLPTEGSSDLMGASANKLVSGTVPVTWVNKSTGETATVGSEINISGQGGGSVFTMDGITFGLEVCLDHMMHKLHAFYQPGIAASGDPMVQIQLIPSWGMSIAKGKLVVDQSAVNPGLVFNVDGSRYESVARETDQTYWCEDHPAHHGPAAVPCPEVLDYFICWTCNTLEDVPGNCACHPPQPRARYHQCVSPKQSYACTQCNKIVSGAPGNCPTHWTRVLIEYWRCSNCNARYLANGHCACANPKHEECRRYYPHGGSCANHVSQPKTHGDMLLPIGTPIPAAAPVAVPSGNAPDLFMQPGQVVVYNAKPLPLARAVP